MLTAAAVAGAFTGCSANEKTGVSVPNVTTITSGSVKEEQALFKEDIAGKVGKHIYYSIYLVE